MLPLLLLLASGCVEPQLPPRVVGVEPSVRPLAAAPETALTVRLVLQAEPGVAALPPLPVALDVYLASQLSPAGFPLLGAKPASRSVHAPGGGWPLEWEVEVAAVAGAVLVPWLDVDGDGEPGAGDRIGDAVALSEGDFSGDGGRVTSRIGRIATTLAASPPRRPVAVTVTGPAGRASRGRLMVIGYAGEPGGRPDFRWSSPDACCTWPETRTIRMPAMPLWVMAGLDAGADGQLDPSDLIGPPVERFDAGRESTLALAIDEALGGRR